MIDPKLPSVVVVEDEAVTMMLYKIKFSEWGLPLNLISAINGFDGLLKIGRYKPFAVIADLKMPGMDGMQMINTLRQDEELKQTLFVAVTCLDDATIQENGGLPEDVTVLSKPVPFEVLESLVRARLETLRCVEFS